MKELKYLPIGVQTFKRIRENNHVYVDKTEHVYRLVIGVNFSHLTRQINGWQIKDLDAPDE